LSRLRHRVGKKSELTYNLGVINIWVGQKLWSGGAPPARIIRMKQQKVLGRNSEAPAH
jgi:hypothetical protein